MRRTFTAAFVVVLLATVAPRASADLSNGLAAHFPFDGNANDASGNGNHGLVFGATLTQDRFGNTNSAYSFDGIDDYVRTLDSPSLNITSDFTLSAWIRISSAANGPIVFSNMLEVSPHDGYSIRLTYEGTLYLLSGDQPLFGQSSVVSGDWKHIAVVQSGTTATLYIDGELDVSGTVGVPTSSGVDQTIGASYSPHYFWDGTLDDIRVYNRALSFAEVQQLHVVPEPTGTVLIAVGLATLVTAGVLRRRDSLQKPTS